MSFELIQDLDLQQGVLPIGAAYFERGGKAKAAPVPTECMECGFADCKCTDWLFGAEERVEMMREELQAARERRLLDALEKSKADPFMKAYRAKPRPNYKYIIGDKVITLREPD